MNIGDWTIAYFLHGRAFEHLTNIDKIDPYMNKKRKFNLNQISNSKHMVHYNERANINMVY